MAGASEKWATGNGPAMLGRACAVLIFVMSTIAAVAAGCGADSGKPPGTGGSATGPGTGGSSSSIPGACPEGATQACHVTLSQHGSVITCYAGTQTCEGGVWGDCIGGAEFHRLAPGAGSAERRDPGADQGDTLADPDGPVFHSLSFSDAGACPDAGFNDPCDPTCMGYPEVPDGGISITGVGNPGWQTGGINGFPPGLTSKGLKNPCYTASDCQFNEFCGNPATNPVCTHDKCAPGAPLVASCDTCVQQVCAKPANAKCCTSSTCTHDLCAIGPKLSSACDPCVASICAASPSCCLTSWTAACTAAVTTVCGQTCSTWSSACVKEVHDTCGDVCSTPKATCTHDICDTGEALANGCDNGAPGGNCVASICAVRASCCTTAWDATCASMVNSTCLKACDPKGICDPWLAGQTDQNCPMADLTIGAPCSGKIPVCNVGTVAAVPPPGGIIVYHWPGASGQLPTCSPNLAAGAACPGITVPIPPGQCVTLVCPGVATTEELMVNPGGAVPECTCQNNWSLYQPGSCEAVVCTGPQTNFNNTTNIINIGIERSVATSTMIPAAGTIWSQIQAGVTGFYADPINVGSRSTLSFFPDSPTPVCNTTTACTTPTTCAARVTQAAVANAAFPMALAATSPAAGASPTSAGYEGMITTATALTATFTTAVHVAVLILASDVTTAACDPSVSAMAAKAATALATSKIRTFVIGIGVPATTTSAIALAGGGQAFDLVANAALGANLTATLNSIRLTLPKCSIPLPAPGLWDPTNPVVGYISGGMNVPQTHVADLAACGGSAGWYYNNNLNPTQVNLCPTLCNTFRATINTSIKLVLTCPTKYAPWSSAPQTYQGTCPPGTQVQWGLFGYDASALSNSSIAFTAQVATTAAGLAAAPVIALGTAQSTPTDTQVCPVPKIPAQMPVPTCAPIDLFTKLGGVPTARYDFLRLSMAFTPNTLQTVTPTIADWQLTYSCVADQ